MPELEQVSRRYDVEALMEVLEKGSVYSKLRAASGLAEIGEPAVQPLIDAITAENYQLRWRAALALGKVGEPATAPLLTVLQAGDASVRVPVMWALAEIGDRQAVAPLVDILGQDPSECCRVMAGAALLKIGDPDGVARVLEACEQQGEDFADQIREAYYGT